MTTIGKRIVARRKLIGITQQELAEKTDVSVSTISQWEQENAEPSISNFKSLCTIFGTSLEWLAYGTGKAGISEYLDDLAQSYERDPRLVHLQESQKTFISAFATLPPDQQDKAIEYTNFLAEKYGQASPITTQDKKK